MCRARFARPIMHPPGGGLKVTEGAHISVILGPGGPIFTVRLGGDLRGGGPIFYDTGSNLLRNRRVASISHELVGRYWEGEA